VKRSVTIFGGRWSTPKRCYVVLKHDHMVFYNNVRTSRVPDATVPLSLVSEILIPEDKPDAIQFVGGGRKSVRVFFASADDA
jgi:hypothetical protein